MKKVFTLTLLITATALLAQGKNVIFQNTFEKMNGWFKNPACKIHDGGGSFSFVPGGKRGNCLKIVTNAKQIFYLNFGKNIPVKDGERLKIILTMKGKGKISLHPMGKTPENKTVYLSGGSEKINSDVWEEIPFIITASRKGKTVKALFFRINFDKNSTLFVDDFRIEKMKKASL